VALLEVRNVSKTYSGAGAAVPALHDVSFSAAAGEFIALVGRSGCGKSTLLNLCGAVDFPSAGEILIDGTSTNRMSDGELTRLRREKTGFIFQSFQLLQGLSVVENVELPLLLARKPDARKTALARLEWVGLDPYAGRLPHQLSGGQQQRVAIARSVVHNPRLLLADEPTGNLDTGTGEAVIGLLRRITREFQAAVLMATHSRESLVHVDRILPMRDGRLEL
jgi:ABC-type lipoprotein export system ATPase subunit